MLFVWVISVALTVLAILNAALSEGVFGVIGVSLGAGVLYTFYAVALAIAIDALLALFIRRVLPGKWFNHKKAVFTVGAGEKNFYETIKIRKWKDKIPEWGRFTGFSKNEIARPFLTPRALLFSLALPVAIINMLCNLPSYFILRYNSYKLEVLYKNNEKRAAREAAKNVPTAADAAAAEEAATETEQSLPGLQTAQ